MLSAGRGLARKVSILREVYWMGAAACLGGAVVYPCAVPVQIVAGALTLYTLTDRMGILDFSLIAKAEERKERLLQQLSTILTSNAPAFQGSGLALGFPMIRYADQGLLGLFWSSLRLKRWAWQSTFTLDVNYSFHNFTQQGYISAEGVYLSNTQLYFTSIQVYQVLPTRLSFPVATKH